MMELEKLYLAHPLVRRHEIRILELQFEEKTGIKLLNPFYDNYGPGGREDIKSLDRGEYVARTIKTKQMGLGITEVDLRLIDSCEGMVAVKNKTDVSDGTPMEFFYNSRILKRPTFLITEDLCGHPWYIAYATEIFKDWHSFQSHMLKRGMSL
jgi:nucleoside 2-deoxyribosyltransferase